MSKLKAFLLIIILSPLIAGLYGIIHDQITYTISPEYYTKFKFYQFGLMDMGNEAIFPHPRIEVSLVGFLATWWFGLFIGMVLALVGWFHKNGQQMWSITMKSIFIVIITTLAVGIAGLIYGKFYLAQTGVNWYLPENLIDKENFIAVGSMHNFSYLGGIIGLISGIIYSVKNKRK